MVFVPKHRLIVLATVALAVMLAAPASDALAVVIGVNDKEGYTEYLGLTQPLTRQAPFRMVVPDRWNGTLIVYARGTGSATLLQGTGPILDPGTGLPILGTNPLANVPGSSDTGNVGTLLLEDALLMAGYAMVSSDYKPDPRFLGDGLLGWVVEDGIRDTIDVTRQARRILEQHPKRHPRQRLENTVLWGRSQGSLIALRLLETRPWLYDSVITGCTVGAGAPRAWDAGMGSAIAFDVAFGEGSWASLGAGSPEGGDIPQDISFARNVVPKLVPFLQIDPNDPEDPNLAKWEFIRLVNGLPFEGFYPSEGFEQFNWIFTTVLFLTEVRGDLESAAKAGGRISQNVDHVYRLSNEDRTYLVEKRGLRQSEIVELLEKMNARTNVVADSSARRYVKRFADVKGVFWGRPVLTAHTIVDGLTPPEHESALRDSAARRGNDDLLVQVFTDAVGHCAFTPDQWFSVVWAMDSWLETGVAPDAGSFPAGQGFINGYQPGPWFQPPQE